MKEKHDVAYADVVGAYLHAKMEELIIIQISGAEVDIICNLNLAWIKFMEADKKRKKILFV